MPGSPAVGATCNASLCRRNLERAVGRHWLHVDVYPQTSGVHKHDFAAICGENGPSGHTLSTATRSRRPPWCRLTVRVRVLSTVPTGASASGGPELLHIQRGLR